MPERTVALILDRAELSTALALMTLGAIYAGMDDGSIEPAEIERRIAEIDFPASQRLHGKLAAAVTQMGMVSANDP